MPEALMPPPSGRVELTTVPHYVWGNACDSWVLLETDGLSIKQEQMPAGTREKHHVHAQSRQFFYLLHGQAIFEVNGERHIATAPCGFHIAPQMPNVIANESDEPLVFLVISQPTTTGDRTNLDAD